MKTALLRGLLLQVIKLQSLSRNSKNTMICTSMRGLEENVEELCMYSAGKLRSPAAVVLVLQ